MVNPSLLRAPLLQSKAALTANVALFSHVFCCNDNVLLINELIAFGDVIMRSRMRFLGVQNDNNLKQVVLRLHYSSEFSSINVSEMRNRFKSFFLPNALSEDVVFSN